MTEIRTGITQTTQDLNELIDDFGMSLTEIAKECGVTPQSVRNWLGGSTPQTAPAMRLENLITANRDCRREGWEEEYEEDDTRIQLSLERGKYPNGDVFIINCFDCGGKITRWPRWNDPKPSKCPLCDGLIWGPERWVTSESD